MLYPAAETDTTALTLAAHNLPDTDTNTSHKTAFPCKPTPYVSDHI